MSIQRWGAFSVVDHKDARRLAVDVLLYDRLVLPIPASWDRDRWVKEQWDPEGLEQRVAQLGELAIPAIWDLKRQKQWAEKFNDLRQDARDMSAAFHLTRRVLAEHGRDYRLDGEGALEVIAAYQSESDFRELDKNRSDSSPASELDFLLAQRLVIPDSEDPEESLDRALQLCGNDKFINRRKRFHDWQRQILSQGILPAEAATELAVLIGEYNEAVRKGEGSFRVETVMLVGSLSAAAAAAFAGAVPTAVATLGIGVLKGAQVISIGNAAIGAILQTVRHLRNKKPPDHSARDFSGAMFHQVEVNLGWQLRTN